MSEPPIPNAEQPGPPQEESGKSGVEAAAIDPSATGPRRAGSAYLVAPDDGPGPGVLLLHSWWGLTEEFKDLAGRFADAGYTALAPDLMGGSLPGDPVEAARVLAEQSADVTADLILSSIVALRAHTANPEAPVAILGWSMGGSWALWAATRAPESICAAVSHYGVTDLDFADLTAPVLVHASSNDPLVTEDALVEMQAHLLLLDKHIEVIRHDARHFFAESGVPVLDSEGNSGARSAGEEAEAESAFRSTLEFLSTHQSSSA